MTGATLVSVVMPTFEQGGLLPQAVRSLRAQTVKAWELIIVDDGSQDHTAAAAREFTADRRVRYVKRPRNGGLGAAVNEGLDRSAAPLVAYLPSDDEYDPDHLQALVAAFRPGVAFAWSGVRHHANESSLDAPAGHPLQLVQVMHRRTAERWLVRDQVETDDLDRLFWRRLRGSGRAVSTGRVTCLWRDHPAQRHKVIREAFDGGLNVFRRRYRVETPLRFHSTDSWPVDERRLYAPYRGRTPPQTADGLRILLVGELAFNPDRILALEERGHRLFGLWTDDGLGDHTVGPLPFGNVTDIPRPGWRDTVRELRPDVIYALLNWRAVPFAHEVLRARLPAPFVWHFKEAPMRCMVRGTWPLLADLASTSDARIFSTAEERDWFEAALPGRLDPGRTHVLDGDLPKSDRFTDDPGPKLGERDGALHTVVLGRPLGFDAAVLSRVAAAGIHVHVHGAVRGRGPAARWTEWLPHVPPSHVHLHPHVSADRWVRVLSRYDAGWLHNAPSTNAGDVRSATWDDLNLPARIPPYMAAGVPLLQRHSPGCVVAGQRLVRETGAGLLYEDLDELVQLLRDEAARRRAQRAAWKGRRAFTFDAHADRLVGVFRSVVRR